MGTEEFIKEQLTDRGITSPEILAAFRSVDRALFVPEEYREEAYEDYPLPIGKGQTISQPYIIALMLQELDLAKTHSVLEVGTGSGYVAALLSRLAGSIVTVERIPSLLAKAQEVLAGLDLSNVQAITGDGALGYEEKAPYDRIIVSAASRTVPSALFAQLAPEGIMVLPLGSPYFQILTRVTKGKDDRMVKTPITECLFVPLVSPSAEEDEQA